MTLLDSDMRWTTDTNTENLGDLLMDVSALVRRFVVGTPEQLVAITLWIAHTHAFSAADCTPYLQITSATKRAGKTRLLEVGETLVARPWFTGRVSAAALMRKVDADRPTLLLDESDAAFGGDKDYAEALRGILNTGYKRSGRCTVCVGQGAKIETQDFSTFSPKAIAGIGKLPDTVADRSIAIVLRRRATDEPCERWRERDGRALAHPLRDRLAAWAQASVHGLRDARPNLPSALGDRAADVWEPLLAIADLAGGSWPATARAAAVSLSGDVEDLDITVQLLADISEVLHITTTDIIATKELIAALVAMEDKPWATWKHDKPISPRGLARLLGPLGIHPHRHDRTSRGYRVDAFTDPIARYLPSQASHRHNPNDYGPESPEFTRHADPTRDTLKSADSPTRSAPVTHGHMERGDRGRF